MNYEVGSPVRSPVGSEKAAAASSAAPAAVEVEGEVGMSSALPDTTSALPDTTTDHYHAIFPHGADWWSPSQVSTAFPILCCFPILLTLPNTCTLLLFG